VATTYKVLGQSKPSAATNTSLYTVPAATATVVSTLAICNDSASATAYRVAVAAASTPTSSEYLVYGASVPANDTVFLTLGVTAQAAKILVVYAASANLVFSAFGSEIT
jgi:hypothetical protein